MKKLKLLAIITIALVAFFNGCKKDDYEAKVFLCPVVVSTIPVDKAIDVPLNQVITATFNDKMDPATINQESFIIQQDGTPIAGTVTYSGLTATFTPSSPLLPDVLYSGTIKTLAKDVIGQSLMEDYNWSFTTIAEVSLSSNPAEGGTISGAGTFDKGSSVNVTATANEGYSFVNWTLNETPVSTNPEYQFTMDGNKALVANFTLQLVVGLSSNPAEGGTITGDGAYDPDESVTVSASANEGFSFTNWTEGTDVVSEDADYTFTITENRELVANFTEDAAEQFTVELSANPAEGGTTTGGGTFDLDESVTVTASANEGYSFTSWTEGTDVVSENADYTFTITENRELVANFTEDAAEQFTVELSANPAEGGTTTGGGTFDLDESVTVTASANEGYSFTSWTEGTDVVSENADYTFTITENRELVANFTEDTAEQFIVDLSANPAEGGTTTGGGTFDLDESVTVTASANEGYSFTSWTEGTDVVSEDADYTFTITENRELVANFTEDTAEQFIVDLSANPAEGGTTTGGGTFDLDESVTVTASANEGYSFTSWTEGTDIVSENADYTFTITENRELVANFTENAAEQFTVELSANPAEGGTTTGGGAYDPDESVTVSASANEGYSFTNWTEGTDVVSENADYTFTITENRELVANFTENAAEQFTVELSANPAEGGTTTGGGTFDLDESVTVTASANEGYSFTNWTEGTDVVSENADYTFTITENRELVANFTENAAEQFTVELSANPAEGGTTTGGGTFDLDESVTVTASANEGYSFTNWTEGTDVVSENADYTFTITENRELVANFTEDAPVGPAAINLGTAGDFSILAKSGISNTGITSIEGDIGVSPAAATAITGFELIMDTDGQSSHTTVETLVTGKVYASDYAPPTPSMLITAISDMETAYTTANNLVTPAPVLEEGAGNISGLTLAPGLYKWSTGVKINPDASVTLSGGANDTWVFQIAQDLTLMSKAQVKLLGGAQAKNITWVVAGQAVLGTESVLFGTILSKTLISLNTGSKVTGRLMAQTAVTLNASTVVEP